jgi:hypothetical protein
MAVVILESIVSRDHDYVVGATGFNHRVVERHLISSEFSHRVMLYMFILGGHRIVNNVDSVPGGILILHLRAR